MVKLMSKTEVYVCSFPKCGNTHASRSLGDLLDCPVTGRHGASPIAKEGLDRHSPFVVYQMHLRPTEEDCGEFCSDAYTASLPRWTDERVVLMLRDPRDAVLSFKAYWDLPSTEYALLAMSGSGNSPVSMDYPDLIGAWLKVFDEEINPKRIAALKYEKLLANPYKALDRLCDDLELPYDPERLGLAVEKNRFANRVKNIEKFGDDKSYYPSYHKGVQQKNLRKAEPGEWCGMLNQKEGKLCQELFGDMLFDLNYETDPLWWRALRP